MCEQNIVYKCASVRGWGSDSVSATGCCARPGSSSACLPCHGSSINDDGVFLAARVQILCGTVGNGCAVNTTLRW